MSYVDAIYNREDDVIQIVERIEGQRRYMDFKPKHRFYYEDERGKFTSMYGTKVSKFETQNINHFKKELKARRGERLFESDINPIFRCLEEHYRHTDEPTLNVCFFDIEVDFDPELGFSSPDDPFNAITAITVHLSWTDQLITLVMPPPTISEEQGQEICSQFENTIMFTNEADMLDAFYTIIDDADVLSGWNSAYYDIPYIIRRTELIMSKEDTKRFCLWNKKPLRKEVERKFGKSVTYDLVGRVHLDYLDLYKKHTYQEQHSYRLDYIGEVEVGERKVVYEGTLDDLYKKDFYKFIEYNRQDVALLVKIDKKKKFIELSNQLAHQNTVLLKTTLGSVALIEQAIVNETHDRGMVVCDRKPKEEIDKNSLIIYDRAEEVDKKSVAGAYVADPQEGMSDWIGSIDINSLYPSVIRCLNMGPETIVGQVRQVQTHAEITKRFREQEGPGPKFKKASMAECWNGVFASWEYEDVINKTDNTLTVDFEEGDQSVELKAWELYNFIYEQGNDYCISANGTIFKTDIEGIIPGLLRRWYAERVEMKGKAKGYWKEYEKALEDGDKDQATLCKKQYDFWDMRQHSRKILLNSLYGALLNEAMRFFDPRIGQSVTLTGRCISRHMGATTNEVITGVKDHKGEAVVYGDTDSVYFSAYKPWLKDERFNDFEWEPESVIDLYDGVAEAVNKTFPPFMVEAFHVPQANAEVIAAGREVVGTKGIFWAKKRYSIMVIDDEGKRQDINGKAGKIKAMGIEIKRSDTPQFMQDFLEDMLGKVLAGAGEEEVIGMVKQFRTDFRDMPGYMKGSPKAVKNIPYYEAVVKNGMKDPKTQKKKSLPGHARASLNYNNLRKAMGDNYSLPIADGQKIIVCQLKDNPMGYKSIAYPVDEQHLPQWFKDLPFNDEAMEDTLIDTKVDNLIGVLKWDLSKSKEDTTFNQLFSF